MNNIEKEQFEYLKKRVEQLEVTVKRLDKIVCAMNQRQQKHSSLLNEFTTGFGPTPDWRG